MKGRFPCKKQAVRVGLAGVRFLDVVIENLRQYKALLDFDFPQEKP